MTTNYSETRQAQIYETLSTQALLNQTTYANHDLLTALKSFADAMIGIVMDETHASHLNIKNLSHYISDLAFDVDLEDDNTIKYLVPQLDIKIRFHHSSCNVCSTIQNDVQL